MNLESAGTVTHPTVAVTTHPHLTATAKKRNPRRRVLEPTLNLPRKRVLFLDHTAAWGGGEVALFNLVLNLNVEKFEPAVLLLAEGPLAERLRDAGVNVSVLPLGAGVANVRKDRVGGLGSLVAAGRSLAFVWKLRRWLKRHPVDLIHTNSLKSDVLGGLAGRLAGVPVIWHVRDRIAGDYLPRLPAAVFRRMAYFVPNYVIANSNATLLTLSFGGRKTVGTAVYSGLAPLNGSHARQVIHDGTELQDSDRAAESRLTVQEPDDMRVGLIGRISPWKGQHIFVRAAAMVHQKYPQCRFLIVGAALFGENEYETEVRALTIRLGLNDVVEFTGFRDDVPAVVAGLDVLVHASTTGEPFGQVIVEGMAAGKPVVATRGGGVPEIVVDGVTGILVPMNDVPTMANTIEKLLADPELRRRMGQAGRQRVADCFTIERTARGVEAVYDLLLSTAQ